MIRLLRAFVLLAVLLVGLPAQAADWYVSSVAYTAMAQWAATHTYAVGNCVRSLAGQAVNAEGSFCASAITTGTSAGSEPTWPASNNGTVVDSGVTWKNVTGQSGFQQQGGVTNTWTAPAARIGDIMVTGNNIVAAGDRVFLSSDHAETQATTLKIGPLGSATSKVSIISVNRTLGNIPPLAADITSGAKVTTTSTGTLSADGYLLLDGVTLNPSGTGQFSSGDYATGAVYLLNSTISLGSNATASAINLAVSNDAHVILDNTPIVFGNAAQSINFSANSLLFEWRNTPSAISGTVPTTKLFANGGTTKAIANIFAVDLSGLGGTTIVSGTPQTLVMNFSKCKLGASYTLPTSIGESILNSALNFIDCDSANTNYNNARVTFGGNLTTETTITRASGATDGTQAISHKIVTNANATTNVLPLVTFESFPIHIWNTATGSSKTATIEIISSASLNNNDIWPECSALDVAGSAYGSVYSSYIATPLTAAAAVTTSTATWNASPATPVKQKLQVTFTPQKVGLVSCIVKVGKASTTVYVDPLITLS